MKNLLLTTALLVTSIINSQISQLEGVWKNTDNKTTYLTIINVDDNENVVDIYSVSFYSDKKINETIEDQGDNYVGSSHYVKRNDHYVYSNLILVDELTMKREIFTTNPEEYTYIFYKKIN